MARRRNKKVGHTKGKKEKAQNARIEIFFAAARNSKKIIITKES